MLLLVGGLEFVGFRAAADQAVEHAGRWLIAVVGSLVVAWPIATALPVTG